MVNELFEPKQRILDTALELAEKQSWERVRLHEVADRAGMTLDEVHRYITEKEDLVNAWFDRADRAVLQASASAEFRRLSSRGRLQRVIMVWLGALAAHRRVTRQMIIGQLEPGHVHVQVAALMRISRTVQWMREAAHRDVAYLTRAVDETALTALYLTVFSRWMIDESPGSSHTAQFLDSILAFTETTNRSLRR